MVKPWTDGRINTEIAELSGYTDTPYFQELAATLRELLELRAIVAKLPKTADGVPVVPFMDDVWIVNQRWPSVACGEWENLDIVSFQTHDDSRYIYSALVKNCYSTREAAEAAKGNK